MTWSRSVAPWPSRSASRTAKLLAWLCFVLSFFSWATRSGRLSLAVV